MPCQDSPLRGHNHVRRDAPMAGTTNSPKIRGKHTVCPPVVGTANSLNTEVETHYVSNKRTHRPAPTGLRFLKGQSYPTILGICLRLQRTTPANGDLGKHIGGPMRQRTTTKRDSHKRDATASLPGASLCISAIQPPCTKLDARWCERPVSGPMGSLLLKAVSYTHLRAHET